jgi:5-methylcytosine-specific restriction enzyme A
MYVSCSYCGGRHERGYICAKRPKDNRTKEANYITRFRSSKAWQQKRNEIKTRDKFLCRLCLKKGVYVFNRLEVHHIYSIAKKWTERIENENLITLCNSCHKMVENDSKYRRELLEIVKNADAF